MKRNTRQKGKRLAVPSHDFRRKSFQAALSALLLAGTLASAGSELPFGGVMPAS